ncbi:MAG TPA: hypothetical protein VH851_05770, partial [Candidatus Binatia bacterium]
IKTDSIQRNVLGRLARGESLPSAMAKRFMLLAVLISGCSFHYMDQGLNALIGKDVRYAFAVLGNPNGKQEFGGETVYIWQNSRSMMFYEPNLTQTSRIRADKNYSETVESGYWVPMQGVCLVRLIAGPDNIVRRWDYNGDALGCDDYVRRLKEVAE